MKKQVFSSDNGIMRWLSPDLAFITRTTTAGEENMILEKFHFKIPVFNSTVLIAIEQNNFKIRLLLVIWQFFHKA